MDISYISKYDDKDSNRKAFNSIRVTDYILSKIFDLESFGWAALLIKYWAKNRNLYGFNQGYFNGVSLVIMMVHAMLLQNTEKHFDPETIHPSECV
jgi:poly(A) polymerase Pap1